MTRKHDIRQIDEIVRRVGLSKEQRDLLHDRVHHERLKYREILEAAREIKQDFPNK